MSDFNGSAGGVQLTDNSGAVKKQLRDVARRALMVIGLKAERYAKANCTEMKAVDTGRLRNSITFAMAGGRANTTSYAADRGKGGKPPATGSYSGTAEGGEEDLAVYIGTNVEYAPYIEFGTERRGPRPFLHNAAADHAAEYREILQRELKKG